MQTHTFLKSRHNIHKNFIVTVNDRKCGRITQQSKIFAIVGVFFHVILNDSNIQFKNRSIIKTLDIDIKHTKISKNYNIFCNIF